MSSKLRKAEFKKGQPGSDTKDGEKSENLKKRRSFVIIIIIM